MSPLVGENNDMNVYSKIMFLIETPALVLTTIDGYYKKEGMQVEGEVRLNAGWMLYKKPDPATKQRYRKLQMTAEGCVSLHTERPGGGQEASQPM